MQRSKCLGFKGSSGQHGGKSENVSNNKEAKQRLGWMTADSKNYEQFLNIFR